MLLVDTYNVLHHPLAMRELPHDSGPAELAALIAAGRHRRSRALLVCDGMPRKLGPAAHRDAELRFHVEGSELLYAGPGRDADSLIERLIEADSAPRRLTVVSSDRRIQRAGRRRKARVMPSHDFLGVLFRDVDSAKQRWRRPTFTTEVPLSPMAIRYWKDLFKIDEADLPAEATEPAKPMPVPETQQAESAKPVPESVHTKPSEPEPIDPVILEALREWRGRLSMDDLDMTKWLGD
jgi:predicted RNA-binding protein with PIN domain